MCRLFIVKSGVFIVLFLVWVGGMYDGGYLVIIV